MNYWTYLRLIYALRETGLPVSTQDVTESLKCLCLYPELPAKTVLKVTLIHRPQDEPVFELIWKTLQDCYGSEEGCAPNPDAKEAVESYGIGGFGTGRGTGGVTIAGAPGSLSFPLLTQLGLLPGASLEVSASGIEELTKSTLAQANHYGMINSLDRAYEKGEISWDEWQTGKEAAKRLEYNLQQELIAWKITTENSWSPLQHMYWRYKPLQNLTDAEKCMVKAAIRQWGRKLAVHSGWQWKNSLRGALNFPTTVKHAFQFDGLIIKLKYHHKIPRTPELLVLCDVSNSVAPYVEFLLNLVVSLRARFRRVRIFFFIDTLWDVSEQFWEGDFSNLREGIASWGRKTSSGFSDYGQVLQELVEGYLSEVSTQATILILGDGKNNYRQAQVEYLAAVADHVRRVIWLNPLNEADWHDRDNVLTIYRSYCSRVYRCQTVDDLQKIARTLF